MVVRLDLNRELFLYIRDLWDSNPRPAAYEAAALPD